MKKQNTTRKIKGMGNKDFRASNLKNREEISARQSAEHLENWIPKTSLGKLVKDKKITNIDEILKHRVLEPEIIDYVLNLKSDILNIGQAKGKFGGGKRRAWRQTKKKTMEGNVISFSTMAVVGDREGHVGIGFGKAKETLPARDKAMRNAKLNIMKVKRGFENPFEDKGEPHTIPFKVNGKCGGIVCGSPLSSNGFSNPL